MSSPGAVRFVPSILLTAVVLGALGCASRQPPAAAVPPPRVAGGAAASAAGGAAAAPEPKGATVLAADGAPIAYGVAGSGSPALVLIHGWSGDRSFWDATARAFSPRHRVVTLDLPGHGASGRRAKDTIAAYGGDVVRVLEALDLKDAVLVGHSMGGPVALEAAARAPGRVVAVVGVDTLQNVEHRPGPEWEQLFASLERDFPGTCRTFVGSIFGAGAEPGLVASVQDRMCDAPPEVAVPLLREVAAHDAARALEGVKVPVRCIQGDRTPTDLEAARRHHADFDVIVVPGTGHFPQLESPEAFHRALQEILRTVPPRRP